MEVKNIFFFILVLLVSVQGASATYVSVQGNGTIDTHVRSGQPTTGYGKLNTIQYGIVSTSNYESLIKFPITTGSNYLATSNATITLINSTSVGAPINYSLYLLTSQFTNNTVWDNKSLYNSVELDTIRHIAGATELKFNISQSTFQGILDGTTPYYGFAIVRNPNSSTGTNYFIAHSTEAANSSDWPKLEYNISLIIYPVNNTVIFSPFSISWNNYTSSLWDWKLSTHNDSIIMNTYREGTTSGVSSPILSLPDILGKYYISVDSSVGRENISIFIGGIKYNVPTPHNFTSQNYAIVNATIHADNISSMNYTEDGISYNLYNKNLVFHYSFDNNSAIGENSSHARDISLSNRFSDWNISSSSWNTTGYNGGSAYFDGNLSRYISTNITRQNATITDEYTVLAAIYPTNVNSAYHVILGDWTSKGRSIHLGITNNNSFHNAVNTSGVQKTVISSVKAYNNTWYVLSSSFKMNSSLVLYLGCTEIANTSAQGTEWSDVGTDNFNDYDIGNRGGRDISLDTINWYGLIDEVYLYNRTLSQVEICKLSNTTLKRINETAWDFSTNITDLSEEITHNYSIELDNTSIGIRNVTKYTSGWNNNDNIKIINTLNETLYNYPVKVTFYDTNTNYSLIKSGGEDLKFELEDGTNLPFYIEKWKGYEFFKFRNITYPMRDNRSATSGGQYVVNLDNDSDPEYLILATYYYKSDEDYFNVRINNASLFALDYDGQTLWEYRTEYDEAMLGIWAGDINEDGTIECVTGAESPSNSNRSNRLIVLNCNNGTQLWNTSFTKAATHDYMRGLWGGNLTGDSKLEIVASSRLGNKIHEYDYIGNEICNSTYDFGYIQKLNIDDIDGDGEQEVVVSGGNYFNNNDLHGMIDVMNGSCGIKYTIAEKSINNTFNTADAITLGQTGYDLFPEYQGNEIISPSFRGYDPTSSHPNLTLLKYNSTIDNLSIMWQKRVAPAMSGVNIAPIDNGSSDVFIWLGWLQVPDNISQFPISRLGGEIMLLDRNGTVLTSYPDTPRGVTAYNLDNNPADIEVMVSNDYNSTSFYKVLRNVSTVWINIPELAPNSETTIIRNYGNKFALSNSSRSAKYFVDDKFQNWTSNLSDMRGGGFKIQNNKILTPDESDYGNDSNLRYSLNKSNIQYSVDTIRISEGDGLRDEYYISLWDRVTNYSSNGYPDGYQYMGGFKNATHSYSRFYNISNQSEYIVENFSWYPYTYPYSTYITRYGGIYNYINDKVSIRISVYNTSHKIEYAPNDVGFVNLFDSTDDNSSSKLESGDIAFGAHLGQWTIDNLTVRNYAFPEPTTLLQNDTTPPNSISNIWFTIGTDYINNHWVNPLNGDFDHIEIYFANDTFYMNTSNSNIDFLNISYSTNYTQNLSTQTVDMNGNINQTKVWLNASIVPEIISFTYEPSTPTNILSNAGYFYVNHSWTNGTGNITNSYNITINNIWSNGSVLNYNNNTYNPHAWSNISIYAYNSSGTGTLNQTPLTNNTRIPNNAPIQGAIGNKNVNEGSLLTFTISSTDTDGDTLSFLTNATNGTLTNDTFSYTPDYSASGTYRWEFNTTDNFTSVATETITVTVNDVSLNFIPPDPISLTYTNGSTWVNHTWSAGVGNITNSYNKSFTNGTWVNDSIVNYLNETVGEGAYSNLTLYAFNNSGSGTLSSIVTQNVKTPDTVIIPGTYNISGYINDTLGNWVNSATIQNGSNVTTSNSSGYYILNNINNGSYNYSFSKTGFNTNYSVIVINGSDNVTNITLSDTTAPGQVTGLTNATPTNNSINISWSAIIDANWYEIFKNDTHLNYTQNIYYNDTGLLDNHTYQYIVRVNDTYNNWGINSSVLNVTTGSNSTTPTPTPTPTPTSVPVSGGGGGGGGTIIITTPTPTVAINQSTFVPLQNKTNITDTTIGLIGKTSIPNIVIFGGIILIVGILLEINKQRNTKKRYKVVDGIIRKEVTQNRKYKVIDKVIKQEIQKVRK